jgi:hypothetical protein
MPSCSIHHSDQASSAMSKVSDGKGKYKELAQAKAVVFLRSRGIS